MIAYPEELDLKSSEQALGSSGLQLQSGVITEEFNQELRAYSRRFQFFREMTKDATIATLLDCIKLPLLASEFTVAAASEEAGDVFLRDFIHACLHGMYRQSWTSHVRDCLEALDFGYAISEIVLEKRADGYLYLRNLEPRGQETLERWEHDPKVGFVAFTQRNPVDGATATIPMDKLVHVTYRGRKGNPEGESFLRPLYRTYKLKKEFEIFEAISVERDVGGMPVAEVPENVNHSDPVWEKFDRSLEGLRRDTISYLRPPPGVKVAAYRGNPGVDVGAILEKLKMDIFFRGFAQFLTLGTTGTGTQALVQGDIDFFHLGLISIQQELLEAWNKQLVPYLLFANGVEPGTVRPPRIQWADPGHVNMKTALESYKLGVEAGLYAPNDADEDYMRIIHDLPPRTSTVNADSSSRSRTVFLQGTPAEVSPDGSVEPLAPALPAGGQGQGQGKSGTPSSSA